MAEQHPPSPVREDDNLSLGRLRVKPAMTIQWSVLVTSQLFESLNFKSLNLKYKS